MKLHRSILLLLTVTLLLPSSSRVLHRRSRVDVTVDDGHDATAAHGLKAGGQRCNPELRGGKARRCPLGCRCVRVLHFNDIYSMVAAQSRNEGSEPSVVDETKGRLTLEHNNQLGGIEHLAVKIAELKADAAAQGFAKTVVTFGGDHLGPSAMSMLATGGWHMIEALNHVGVDVAAWGNHELDFGTEGALNQLRCSRFPWLSANVYLGGASSREPIGARYERRGADWGEPGVDFAYNPPDGIHEIRVGSTKLCFTSLTSVDVTMSSMRKRFNTGTFEQYDQPLLRETKYLSSIRRKRPWFRRAPCWSTASANSNSDDSSSNNNNNNNKKRKARRCSIADIVASCPRHVVDGKADYSAEELTVPKKDVGTAKHWEGFNKVTGAGSWQAVIDRLQERARYSTPALNFKTVTRSCSRPDTPRHCLLRLHSLSSTPSPVS